MRFDCSMTMYIQKFVSNMFFVRFLFGEMSFSYALLTYFIIGSVWLIFVGYFEIFLLDRSESGYYILSSRQLIIIQISLILFWLLPIGLWRCSTGSRMAMVIGRILSGKDFVILVVSHFVFFRSFMS